VLRFLLFWSTNALFVWTEVTHFKLFDLFHIFFVRVVCMIGISVGRIYVARLDVLLKRVFFFLLLFGHKISPAVHLHGFY